MGRGGRSKVGGIHCIHMADSPCPTAETQHCKKKKNYTLIINFLRKFLSKRIQCQKTLSATKTDSKQAE